MAIVASRNRLIYFRVSEEELERFRSLAESKGARSLSGLAREAMERLQHGGSSESEIVPVLLERIHILQNSIEKMNDRLEELHLRIAAQGGRSEEETTA